MRVALYTLFAVRAHGARRPYLLLPYYLRDMRTFCFHLTPVPLRGRVCGGFLNSGTPVNGRHNLYVATLRYITPPPAYYYFHLIPARTLQRTHAHYTGVSHSPTLRLPPAGRSDSHAALRLRHRSTASPCCYTPPRNTHTLRSCHLCRGTRSAQHTTRLRICRRRHCYSRAIRARTAFLHSPAVNRRSRGIIRASPCCSPLRLPPFSISVFHASVSLLWAFILELGLPRHITPHLPAGCV